MIGIIFFGIFGLWLWGAFKLAKFITRKLRCSVWSELAILMLTLLFIALPLADEIIGGFQFRALCKKNAATQSESERIRGKTVRSVVTASQKEVGGILSKIQVTHVSYRDAESNDELASYSIYNAKGGWLARILWTGEPITFKSTCSGESSIKSEFKRID